MDADECYVWEELEKEMPLCIPFKKANQSGYILRE